MTIHHKSGWNDGVVEDHANGKEVYVVYSYRGEHGTCCFEHAFRNEDDAKLWRKCRENLDKYDPHRPEATYYICCVNTPIEFED